MATRRGGSAGPCGAGSSSSGEDEGPSSLLPRWATPKSMPAAAAASPASTGWSDTSSAGSTASGSGAGRHAGGAPATLRRLSFRSSSSDSSRGPVRDSPVESGAAGPPPWLVWAQRVFGDPRSSSEGGQPSGGAGADDPAPGQQRSPSAALTQAEAGWCRRRWRTSTSGPGPLPSPSMLLAPAASAGRRAVSEPPLELQLPPAARAGPHKLQPRGVPQKEAGQAAAEQVGRGPAVAAPPLGAPSAVWRRPLAYMKLFWPCAAGLAHLCRTRARLASPARSGFSMGGAELYLRGQPRPVSTLQ